VVSRELTFHLREKIGNRDGLIPISGTSVRLVLDKIFQVSILYATQPDKRPIGKREDYRSPSSRPFKDSILTPSISCGGRISITACRSCCIRPNRCSLVIQHECGSPMHIIRRRTTRQLLPCVRCRRVLPKLLRLATLAWSIAQANKMLV
jgi:hypothetical protein